jgi:hypothetical protein
MHCTALLQAVLGIPIFVCSGPGLFVAMHPAFGGLLVTKPRNPHLVTTVKCAVPGCTNVRREANHWFVTSADQRFICRPYSATTYLRLTDEPACGQACAQKLFERYLAKQAL